VNKIYQGVLQNLLIIIVPVFNIEMVSNDLEFGPISPTNAMEHGIWMLLINRNKFRSKTKTYQDYPMLSHTQTSLEVVSYNHPA
jgi:hypothetical protein